MLDRFNHFNLNYEFFNSNTFICVFNLSHKRSTLVHQVRWTQVNSRPWPSSMLTSPCKRSWKNFSWLHRKASKKYGNHQYNLILPEIMFLKFWKNVKNEFHGFERLFKRYLEEDNTEIKWQNIEPLNKEAVWKYSMKTIR